MRAGAAYAARPERGGAHSGAAARSGARRAARLRLANAARLRLANSKMPSVDGGGRRCLRGAGEQRGRGDSVFASPSDRPVALGGTFVIGPAGPR
ncbi:MAG: hypothetical protein D6689_09170 [Deltaproteobacteria bacterium]|nr:MAG: hypothetical protein D6689_09170 [Deltaproteobacteria bacterium]